MYSMTGYGLCDTMIDDVYVKIEMKSVNHRYLESAIRMPREWIRFEDALKKRIKQRISRGKLDVFITVEQGSHAEKHVSMDSKLASSLRNSLTEMQHYFNVQSVSLHDLLQVPDLIKVEQAEMQADENVQAALLQCLDTALSQLINMRFQEAVHIKEDLIERLTLLEKVIQQIDSVCDDVKQNHREKLRNRLKELLEDSDVDEVRFTMEVALLADRSDISEELTRLKSHCKQFYTLMETASPIGRKIDFLIQEMNRETNTIASKVNDLAVTNHVIHMKSELEKIREQIQNIE
ncbi:YicC/YloC family endoribonuclease [Longirhabdus pacifica]|uniref:YicC/YloC family endoribonuclease n=1 Tax=Longirhabdus pacifica TaxID=2305227 RepID=UPI0013E8AB37|nr:YicC/YloC family endoribonuclease [Longirhabdus pacifica]